MAHSLDCVHVLQMALDSVSCKLHMQLSIVLITVYGEYSLIRRNLFSIQRIWWINEVGGITGYSLVLVHHIGTEKVWQIKKFGG